MYRIKLKNFEGPLDLLLFFIKRDELEIYDIPIAYITRQFLEYIRLLEELDLEVASEFILMASMLMSIKAKMMLPAPASQEDEMDEYDPRYELVQRLLEYKRYKEMGSKMRLMANEAHKSHFRGYHKADHVPKQAQGEALKEVTLFDLMTAFKNVLADMNREPAFHRVEKVKVTIEQQTIYLLNLLRDEGKSSFKSICKKIGNSMKIVVTFLATLEMLKEQQIALFIEDDPTDFYLDLTSFDSIMESSSVAENTSS